MKRQYVAALKSLLASVAPEQIEAILKNFRRILKQRGHASLYVPVLRTVERELPQQYANQPLLIVAKESTAQLPEVARAVAEFGIPEPQITVDDSIIGGYKLRTADRELDRTYKSALLTIYRKLTT